MIEYSFIPDRLLIINNLRGAWRKVVRFAGVLSDKNESSQSFYL